MKHPLVLLNLEVYILSFDISWRNFLPNNLNKPNRTIFLTVNKIFLNKLITNYKTMLYGTRTRI